MQFALELKRRVQYPFALLPLAIIGCVTLPPITQEERTEEAAEAVNEWGFASAAALKQSMTALKAPALRQELQRIADEISFAANVGVIPRIHLINDETPHLISFEHGEIFVFSGYLDLVDNRDEMAFALAREIAGMDRKMRLREVLEHYRMERASHYQQLIGSMIVATFVYSVLSEPAVRLTREIYDPRPVPAFAIDGKVLVDYGQLALTMDLFNSIYSLTFGGVATGIANRAGQAAAAYAAESAARVAEEWDDDLREEKDRLGCLFAEQAGYDPRAAAALIQKLQLLHSMDAAAVEPESASEAPADKGGQR